MGKVEYPESRYIYFYAPTIKKYETNGYVNKPYPFFVPVSITGSNCRLKCDHCKGRLLESMYEAITPESLYKLALKLKAQGCKGLLISGGADTHGCVPLNNFSSVMARLKLDMGFKMAVHTGLVDEETGSALKNAHIDVAMVDIIGSDDTIREVYHLNLSTKDYENSLKNLNQRDIKISPHVVIGLHYGKILGEYNALDIISKYKIASLVLVVLNPMSNTPMVNVVPPSVEDVREIILYARKILPTVPILLGCARPGGKYKAQLDRIAIDEGINGIAYPDEDAIIYAKEIGITPVFSEFCCSFIFESMEFKTE